MEDDEKKKKVLAVLFLKLMPVQEMTLKNYH